jgi:hypothetical protein
VLQVLPLNLHTTMLRLLQCGAVACSGCQGQCCVKGITPACARSCAGTGCVTVACMVHAGVQLHLLEARQLPEGAYSEAARQDGRCAAS